MPAIAWAKEDGLAGAQTLRAKGLAHSDAEVVDRLVDDGNGDSHDRGKPRRRLPRHRTPHRRADARGVKTRARESGNRKEGTDRSTKTWIHLETMPEGIDQALAKCGQSWPIHLKRKPVMGTSTEIDDGRSPSAAHHRRRGPGAINPYAGDDRRDHLWRVLCPVASQLLEGK